MGHFGIINDMIVLEDILTATRFRLKVSVIFTYLRYTLSIHVPPLNEITSNEVRDEPQSGLFSFNLKRIVLYFRAILFTPSRKNVRNTIRVQIVLANFLLSENGQPNCSIWQV